MNTVTAYVLAALGCCLGAQAASAQELSHYRGYVLESSLEWVMAQSDLRGAEVKTVHLRPARIQEVEWLAPYVGSDRESADPVHDITFTFYNDTLYRIVVRYHRDRIDGLTNTDIVESLTATYGTPVARSARSRPASALRQSVVLAQWEDNASSVMLLRDSYSPEFQLVLVSKALSTRASDAIRQAIRLDAIEAPRRELEQRKREAADTSAARETRRATNKAAFRP